MVKMPDLSEFKKKVNIQSMVDNVKTAIDTVSTPKAAPTDDELFNKFVEVNELMKNLSEMNAQQANAIANIKSKISALDKDIQTVKGLAAGVTETQQQSASTGNSDKLDDTVAVKPIETKAEKPEGDSKTQ